MLFKIKDILPNPFRHIERYPLRPEKIQALRESIRTTGYWRNILARPAPAGKAEIAYAHHRMEALRQEFGPEHKIELILQELDDTAMLQIMARENMEEWGTSAAIEHETVRAVVEAYAAGRIQLDPPAPDTSRHHLRYAPSFVMGDPRLHGGERPYTAKTVGRFLGWMQIDKQTKRPGDEPQAKVGEALSALEFIEEGILDANAFEGLKTKEAMAVISEARKARERRIRAAKEAEEAAKKWAAEKAAAERRAAEAKVREEAARKEREAAAAERRAREAEAAKAKERKERERAEAAAKDAERRRAEAAKRQAEAQAAREKAEGERKGAAGLEARNTRTAAAERDKAKGTAREVGRGVADAIKTGKAGYEQAGVVAEKLQPASAPKPPPDINKFAERMAAELAALFVGGDPRVAKLKQIAEHGAHLRPDQRTDLTRTLRSLARRILDHADAIEASATATPAAPAKTARPALTMRSGA